MCSNWKKVRFLLEKALQQFEKGVKLSRECQQALESAEQRVKVLLDDGELAGRFRVPTSPDKHY